MIAPMPGPWVMRRVAGCLFFIQRKRANGRIEHLEYTSDGHPMYWDEEQARDAIAKAMEARL